MNAKATAAAVLNRALETLRGRGSSGRAPAAGEAHPSLVTEQDVEACYRLLHGRVPDEDGRRYWAAAVGRMTVAELVGAFVDSREFHLGDLYRRIAAGRPVETSQSHLTAVDLPGRVQYVDPDDQFVGAAIARDHIYEPHLTRAISDVLKEGDGFIDVGANIGWFSLLAASIVGATGRVLAIEADPANVGLVLRSAQASGFGNVTVVSAAAGATSGAMLLQRAGGSNGVAYLPADATAPDDRWVPAVTLDSLSGMLSRVQVMKVDVEGAELLVLRGASETITRDRPVVFVEFSPGMLSRFDGSGTSELQSWLDEHQYHPAIVAFDGARIDLPSLRAAEEYCRRGSYQHVDLQLTP